MHMGCQNRGTNSHKTRRGRLPNQCLLNGAADGSWPPSQKPMFRIIIFALCHRACSEPLSSIPSSYSPSGVGCSVLISERPRNCGTTAALMLHYRAVVKLRAVVEAEDEGRAGPGAMESPFDFKAKRL